MSLRFSILMVKSLMKLDMNSILVLNASPIILLGKADLLRTVGPLAEFWFVPDGVATEVEKKRPINPYIADLKSCSKVSMESVSQINPPIAAWDLGQGESEVLSLAMQKGPGTKAVLDDLQARKCAKLLDIGLIGSLGLLVMAKRVGLINAAKPEINKLIEVGIRINPDLLAKIYQGIGE